jgi:ABC-2 type transport system permease protein
MPSALGMGVAFGGLVSMAAILTIEREDGTLLRAKAIPDGMLGYLIGKIVLVSGMGLISFLIQFVPGLFFLRGLTVPGLRRRLCGVVARARPLRWAHVALPGGLVDHRKLPISGRGRRRRLDPGQLRATGAAGRSVSMV